MKETKTLRCDKCQGRGKLVTVNPDWLRSIREKSGISLRAMARKIGISAAYLCDIELGKRAVPEHVVGEYRRIA